MASDLDQFCVDSACSLKEVMTVIGRNGAGIVLVVDECRRLQGTITDGDVRRAILAGMNLDAPASAILTERGPQGERKAVTAPAGTPETDLLELMKERKVRHVPLLDTNGVVEDLILLSDLLEDAGLPVRAVVMAGGFGKRLHPLTEDVPKPMLSIGDRPLLERIVDQLKAAGIHRLNITTHFQTEVITNHFGDGTAFDMEIGYTEENQPLGTAGALALMERPAEPLLVMNGDILTQVDFRALHRFHEEHEADMTVGVRQFDLDVPYGVVETQGVEVRAIREKPNMKFFVNAGIYLLEPDTIGFIPAGCRFDMTDLIARLIDGGKRVVSFPISEYWLDIGQQEDYERAQKHVADSPQEGTG